MGSAVRKRLKPNNFLSDIGRGVSDIGRDIVTRLQRDPLIQLGMQSGEALRRGQEIAQGAFTAGTENVLEAAGGGSGEFRRDIASRGGGGPFSFLGSAGDVVRERRGELPGVNVLESKENPQGLFRLDLLDLQDIAVPLPVPGAAKTLRQRAIAPRAESPRFQVDFAKIMDDLAPTPRASTPVAPRLVPPKLGQAAP